MKPNSPKYSVEELDELGFRKVPQHPSYMLNQEGVVINITTGRVISIEHRPNGRRIIRLSRFKKDKKYDLDLMIEDVFREPQEHIDYLKYIDRPWVDEVRHHGLVSANRLYGRHI